jgi:pimeloyl-ACP methyl ester carboxylesterase
MTTGPRKPESLSGDAAGVPFIAFAPDTDHGAEATVFVWHLHDPPRSETAMAAALPLRGIDAWRVYLGLPLSGKRLPPGGLDAFFALGYEDAVLNLYGPTVRQAVREFPRALTELRRRHGLGRGEIALVGASIGSLVAASVIAAGEPAVAALALVSPALRLERLVAMNERRFAITYPWADESRAVAAELDFITRAPELAERNVPTLLVVGADDDEDGIIDPAEQLRETLNKQRVDVSLVRIPGLAHALADEPGLDPAPQTAAAAAVDETVTRWLTRHLPDPGPA